MTKAYDATKVAKLAEQILHHKSAYYRGKPEISDSKYDKLEAELAAMAPTHPVLSVVGSEAVPSGKKVEHDVPMLSLQKTYALDELHNWAKGQAIVGSLKVDGNSLSVVYENGEVVLAKTRGNGRVGEDVTDKIRWVADVVPRLPTNERIEIRGELYCTDSQFFHLSEEMVKRKLERPTAPRNVVAGILGRKTHYDLACYFNFFAFDVVQAGEKLDVTTEMAKFRWLESQGFSTPHAKLLKNEEDIASYLQHVRDVMNDDEIGIDGAVFSYDDLPLHAELGNTSHHPRYKMSFKWQGDTAEAKIKSFTWATSRRGIVTPVAVIEPVVLSGATITNITLHNAAHVKTHNLKAGDVIEIVRSGEVIPKFLNVVKSAKGNYQWPSTCPSCDHPLEFDDVRLRCPNSDACPAQQLRSILNWIKSVEIDDLSEKRLIHLVDAELVGSPADLYKLGMDDFFRIPNTKEKMATKLLRNIDNSRTVDLARFLLGLGIEGTGLTSWEKLLMEFGSLQAIRKCTPEQIAAIDGFAEKTAQQIVEGLALRSDLIDELLANGVKPQYEQVTASGDMPLSGKTIVITGTLSMPRAKIEAAIKKAGGGTAGSVSKNTHAVLTSDPTSNSSKMKKARDLGVLTWGEEDLWAVIGAPD